MCNVVRGVDVVVVAERVEPVDARRVVGRQKVHVVILLAYIAGSDHGHHTSSTLLIQFERNKKQDQIQFMVVRPCSKTIPGTTFEVRPPGHLRRQRLSSFPSTEEDQDERF